MPLSLKFTSHSDPGTEAMETHLRNIIRNVMVFLPLILLVAGCGRTTDSSPPQSVESGIETATAWKVIGPGGGGGVANPTINPADPDHFFVNCDMTGAYVTYDGGRSWRMFSLWSVPTDFEFDPGDPDAVYAASSGYIYSEDRGSALSLLYRSENRGRSWRIIYPDVSKAGSLDKLQTRNLLPSQIIEGAYDGTISKIKVDPADNRRIFLAIAPLGGFMGGGRRDDGQPARLILSTDRGMSWRLVAELPGRQVLGIYPGSLRGVAGEVTVFTEKAGVSIEESSGKMTPLKLPADRISNVAFGRDGKGTILYLVIAMQLEGGKISGGVYRSRDWAKSWTQVNSGLLMDVPAGNVPTRIGGLGVCETSPEVAYLSSRNAGLDPQDTTTWRFGIFKTENAGESWKPVWLSNSREYLTGNYDGSWLSRSFGPGWCGNPGRLSVAPSNAEICVASDGGRAFRTEDGGRTWHQLHSRNQPDGSVKSTGLDVTTCYGIHFDPFDKQHIFITYTDIGLWHSFDGGESWFHAIEGIPRVVWSNTCYWIEFDPQVRGKIWSVWTHAHDLPRVKMFTSGFENQQGGVGVSLDSGRTWSKSNQGLPANAVCTNILLDPKSPVDSRTLYICVFDHGVYKSTDGGGSWLEANQGLGDNRFAWQLRRNSAGRIYVLSARGSRTDGTPVAGTIYYTDNGATSWQPLALPEGTTGPHDLQIDPAEPRRMYLSCWPRNTEAGDVCGGIYRTEDGGSTWKQLFDERIRVNSAALDPADPAVIYINTFHNAAYRSDDRGETWKRLEGYRFKWGQRAIPDPNHPGMLYLTTYGGSVFYGPARGVAGAFEGIENMPQAWW